MSRRTDVPAVVGGLVVLALGALLLLDRVDAVRLGFAEIGPVFLAACGAILLAAGLDNRDREDADGS